MAITYGDIDLGSGSIRIDKAATAPSETVTVKTTKAGTVRVLKVKDANLDLLREAIGTPGPSAHFVIDGGRKPIRPAIITERFSQVRKLAKLRPGITFHTLRHAWATGCLVGGMSLHDVAHLGGWKSVDMVARVYGHA